MAQLPAKFGDMAVRTFGAQHLCSLAKSAHNVERIVGEWDVVTAVKCETEDWLKNTCEESVDVEVLVNRQRAGDYKANAQVPGCTCNYSLAQLCELNEQKKVSKLMSLKERLNIEAHSGQNHEWVTVLPLSYKKYNLTSTDWVAAARAECLFLSEALQVLQGRMVRC